MLELKNIKKSYKTGDFIQHALKGINLKFRKNEFVAILGPSGSGKTTLLNIIGGLDRYDSGDLIINNSSTKKYKDKNWDYYRNNCVGFIFQNYNLINHISILENVILSITLSGYKKNKRKKVAIEALKKVGLEKHIHKKPNQLSGGQMQRVAIARALVNNPDIILADEPTGALDSKTSLQIMNLIKEIAKDKLVIMVTHNSELARNYANRIIEFKDGEVIKDSNPINDEEILSDKLNIKKTKMSYLSAINLSFNNLRTKKGRTFITSFASSIGIIGIALILALSNGFQIKIDEFEKDTLAQAPIVISDTSYNLEDIIDKTDLEDYTDKKKVYKYESPTNQVNENNITDEYVNYLNNIDSKLISAIQYSSPVSLNVFVKNDKVSKLDDSIFSSLPMTLDGNISNIMKENYDLLEGEFTNDTYSVYLLVDSKNRVDKKILEALGYKSDEISFSEIIGKELKIVLNDDYYKSIDDIYFINSDYEELYNNTNNITIKIAGILRGKKDNMFASLSGTGLLYSGNLIDVIVNKNKNSSIVKAQQLSNYSVITQTKFDSNEDLELALTSLGLNKRPTAIQIYPKDFSSKKKLLKYLDKYNKSKENKINYTDQSKMITSLSGNIMSAITIVLIAFSSISLIVSSIMVGIITYTSVLERTKEIGILRAIGARKKDIARVFNAEVLIIGFFSGVLGILIAKLLIIPVNIIIKNLTNLDKVAKLNPTHAILLVIISMTLTFIGGLIPAKLASKKDPVIALKAE